VVKKCMLSLVTLSLFVATCMSQSLQRVTAQTRSGAPTKEKAIQTLRDYQVTAEKIKRQQANARDYDRLISLMQFPPDANKEKIKQQWAKLAKGSPGMWDLNVSAKGISIIAERGTWGKARQVDAVINGGGFWRRHIERANVPEENCYALIYSPGRGKAANALFYWNGTQFKIVYLANIDDLERSQ
jgi:hypothetical protein